MSGTLWTPAQLKKLEQEYNKKPKWMTDYVLAGKLAKKFNRTPESIRWQLKQFHRTPVVTMPKILLLDIETLPINADVWGTWKQNIYAKQIRKDWSIVCWSAKWLFDSKVMGQVVKPQEAIDREDASILGGMWDLVNEADAVITQNGDKFDIKKLNTRWLMHGYPRPMYYKSIDTYKVLTENFDFTYNGQDWVCSVLGLGRKIETSFEWWKECADGNQMYLSRMLDYNKQDVNMLEELYLKLRPWMTGHMNLNLFSAGNISCCPNCGDIDLHWSGKYSTPLGLYRAFRCQRCGAIGRSTKKQFKLAKSDVQ